MARPMRNGVIAVLLTVVATSAIAGGQFIVNRERVDALKVIAVLPVTLPLHVRDELKDEPVVQARIAAAMSRRLRAAGYEVIEPDKYLRVRAAIIASSEPLYDAFTRREIDNGPRRVDALAVSQFLGQYKPDAVLEIELVPVFAVAYNGTATWDNVHEDAPDKVFFGLIHVESVGPYYTSFTHAYSLRFNLRTPKFERLYSGVGGLQLRSYGDAQTDRHNPRPAPLFADERREEQAATLALGEWLQGRTEKKGEYKIRFFALPPPPGSQGKDLRSLFSRDAFASAHKILALSPLSFEEVVESPRDVQARYEKLVTERLVGMGFTVLPTTEFSAAWEKAKKESGGFYDVMTGLAKPGERDKALQAVLSELRAKSGASALVFAQIAPRPTGFWRGIGEWDGTSQTVSGETGKLMALGADADKYYGVMPALSLELNSFDAASVTQLVGRGGIQIVKKLVDGKFVDLPPSEWFAEEANDARAVELALAPLLPPPPPTEKKK